jgi:hypothetical protein
VDNLGRREPAGDDGFAGDPFLGVEPRHRRLPGNEVPRPRQLATRVVAGLGRSGPRSARRSGAGRASWSRTTSLIVESSTPADLGEDPTYGVLVPGLGPRPRPARRSSAGRPTSARGARRRVAPGRSTRSGDSVDSHVGHKLGDPSPFWRSSPPRSTRASSAGVTAVGGLLTSQRAGRRTSMVSAGPAGSCDGQQLRRSI